MDRDKILERFDREIGKMGVRIKDADRMKVEENVFDEVTLLALYRLVHKKKLNAIGGSISTGKEANVFYAEGDEGPLAVKIYRIQSANFQTMSEYLVGDPRFSQVRNSRKEIIFTWTRKEYSNLLRAKEAGLPVPGAFYFDRNILIMEFLGEDERPYPQIRRVEMDDPESVYHELVGHMKTLYRSAGLIHADLSEFNILWDGERPLIIDMGQSVTPDHPRAHAFLARDIANLNRFFSSRCKVTEEKEIFIDIVGSESFEI